MIANMFTRNIFPKSFRIGVQQRIRSGSNYQNRRKKLVLDHKEDLYSAYPSIKKQVLDDQLIYYIGSDHVRDRYSKFLDYVCIRDIMYLSNPLLHIHAYKYFVKQSNLSTDNLKKAIVIAWCMKLLDAALTVTDDVLDNQHIRYGKPTWMTIVGEKSAIMDAKILETSITYLLTRYFDNHPQFANILREIAICLSAIAVSSMLDVQKYKLEEFEANDNYVKTYGCGVTPVLCAMYAANINDPGLQQIVRRLTMDICHYTKIEDDFEGVFYPVSKTEKECPDISENRITWPAIQVAKYGTPSQKEIFLENYGKKDPLATAKVLGVYNEMNLEQAYHKYQETFYEDIYKKIQDLPPQLPKQLFVDILDFTIMGGFRA